MESDPNKFLIFSLLIICMMIIFVLSHHLFKLPSFEKKIKTELDRITDIHPAVIKDKTNLGVSSSTTGGTGISNESGITYDQNGNQIYSGTGPGSGTGTGIGSGTGSRTGSGTGSGTGAGLGPAGGGSGPGTDQTQSVQTYIQNLALRLVSIASSPNTSSSGGNIFNPFFLTTPPSIRSGSVTLSSTSKSPISYNVDNTTTSITSFSSVTPTPTSSNSSLSTSLSNYIYLGKVNVVGAIIANSNTANLKPVANLNNDLSLTTGMFIKIDKIYYQLTKVEAPYIYGAVKVTFDKNIPIEIKADSSLDLYTTTGGIFYGPSTIPSSTPTFSYSNIATPTPTFSYSNIATPTPTPGPTPTPTPTPGPTPTPTPLTSTTSRPTSSTSQAPIKPPIKINYPYSSNGLIEDVSIADADSLSLGDTVMFNDNLSTGVVYIIDKNEVLQNYVIYVNQLNYKTPAPSSTPSPPILIPYPPTYGGYIKGVPESLAKKLSKGTKILFNDNISTGTVYIVDYNSVMNDYNIYINELKYVTPTPMMTPTPTRTPTMTPTPTPTMSPTPTATPKMTPTPTPTPIMTPTPTPTPTIPVRPSYVLHLYTASAIDSPLFFVPYNNVSSDDLQKISSQINITPEIFTLFEHSKTVQEGLGSYGTGNSDPGSFNSCAIPVTPTGSNTTAPPIDFSKASILYITDCLSYPIYSVTFKNNVLTLMLDTNDTRTINAGYYRIVI